MKPILILIVVLFIAAFSISPYQTTTAQDSFQQTFTSCDTSFTFQYPANMVVDVQYPAIMVVDKGKEIIHVYQPDGIGNGHLYLQIVGGPNRLAPPTMPDLLNLVFRLSPQFESESTEMIILDRTAARHNFTRTQNDRVYTGYSLSVRLTASEQTYYELWAMAEADEQAWPRFSETATRILNTVVFNPLVNFPDRNNESYYKLNTEHCITSFEYPAEWVLMEYTHQILFFNSEQTQLLYFSSRPFEDQHLAVKIILPEHVEKILGEPSQNLTAEQVLRQVAELNRWVLGLEIVHVEINDYRGLQAAFRDIGQRSVRDGLISVVEFDDGQHLIVSALSGIAGVDRYSEVIDQLLDTIRYQPSQTP